MSQDFRIDHAPVRRRGKARKPSQRVNTTSAAHGAVSVPNHGKRKRLASLSAPVVKPTKRSRLAPAAIPAHTAFPPYRNAIDERRLGFYQIDHRTWVAELCNLETLAPVRGIDGWAILQSEIAVDGVVSYVCTCADYKAGDGTCVHNLGLCSDDRPPFAIFSEEDIPRCILFDHSPAQSGCEALSLFVTYAPGSGREIVSHYGTSSTTGQWTCRKHKDKCGHITAARKSDALAHIFEESPSIERDTRDQDEIDAEERCRKIASASQKSRDDERSVSHRDVGPPIWARLPEDEVETIDLISPIPDKFELGSGARCRCGSPANPSAPVRTIPCIVFDERTAVSASIEVQLCGTCKVQSQNYAGPDLAALGIFNFNNSRLYTHNLLNKYTSMMSCSEMPFHAFHTIVCRDYQVAKSPIPFVSDQTFRTVFYSFTRLQKLGDSFCCPLCGPEPDILLFDGVTAGYDARYLTGSLRPPTTTDENSPERHGVMVPDTPLSIISGELRKRAQAAVRWRLGRRRGDKGNRDEPGDEDADEDEDDVFDEDVNPEKASKQASKTKAKRKTNELKIRQSLELVLKQLALESPALATLFGMYVKSEKIDHRKDDAQLYLRLLEQLFAYESVLQFAPRTSWPALQLIADNEADSRIIQSLLSVVPAFALVAQHELLNREGISSDLRAIASLVIDKATTALSSLSEHNPDDDLIEPIDEDWRETGSFYGRPRIRNRPRYPNLKSDQSIDRSTVTDSKGKIGCNKFFQLYVEKGLTGGLMAAWCPHSVCYGFHVIPKGEGRNDVFSALYTHWKRPPKTIIYDFACALAPYCMLREPVYFVDTQFVLDAFHEEGHWQCTMACFLTQYRDWSAELGRVNSSAAELGNSGLHKIRRAVSYMTQRHAIIMCYTFLALWNRAHRQK